ncbi:phosphopantothenoylcysteine decarboxylase isoform X3 [Pipistrellus kuhlii]|uniref:phosphopantothenoylcysteine decarboxylase isoform X3 n=1 Tax=Pipistrellus kuhlii TaxID=59472 RepID=UPI001E26FDC5|nr:phosphopantothenoylcysteine decarboxylase isoform X3 [Pipistrellus kuhlii]
MEPSSGRLPGLEATRSHMEPRASCPAAEPLIARQFHVLVGVTGSVAALKLPLLVSKLLDISGTCVIRAWDRRKPLLFCPAMNTAMWEHPLTSQQVGQLQAFGYIEIPCVAKKLVCGDQGLGAMAEVDTIVDKVKEVLSQHAGFQQS